MVDKDCLGAMLFLIIQGIRELSAGDLNPAGMLPLLLLSVILPIFLLWIWLTIYYVLDEKNFIIKYGALLTKKTLGLQAFFWFGYSLLMLSSALPFSKYLLRIKEAANITAMMTEPITINCEPVKESSFAK